MTFRCKKHGITSCAAVCMTDDSVINATIDMTGRRIKLMDEVARILTTRGRSLLHRAAPCLSGATTSP